MNYKTIIWFLGRKRVVWFFQRVFRRYKRIRSAGPPTLPSYDEYMSMVVLQKAIIILQEQERKT